MVIKLMILIITLMTLIMLKGHKDQIKKILGYKACLIKNIIDNILYLNKVHLED